MVVTQLLSMDTINRNALIAGLTVAYSGGVSSVATLDAPVCNIDFGDVVKQISTLEANDARALDNGRFVMIVHPHTYATLFQDPVFVNLFVEEGDSGALRTGRMGSILNCDIYMSSNCYELVNQGVDSLTDIYGTIILAADAFCVAGMASLMPNEVDNAGMDEWTMTGKVVRPVEMIVKPVDSGGADNPLNQRGSIGWKASNDVEILDANWGIVLKHTTVFSDD